jgi:hypothetical protein
VSRPLLIALGTLLASLCGLCIFQWKRESDFRAAILDLSTRLHGKSQALSEAEARIETLQTEITRIETLRADTEAKYLATLDELRPLQLDWTARGHTIFALSQYAAAAESQNDAIAKQNELLKQLASERDAAIEKLNARTREFNALTEKYNKLVK